MVVVVSKEDIKKVKGDIQQVKTAQRASQKRERDHGAILLRIEKRLTAIEKAVKVKW